MTHTEIRDAAEVERRMLIEQATKLHLDNLAAEARRYERELADIEHVYKLRTGQEA